jgi:hypothetical protein
LYNWINWSWSHSPESFKFFLYSESLHSTGTVEWFSDCWMIL